MQTCRPQCPRALQPRGKCENGLRFGSYVLAAARWSWQIVQEMRACCRRPTRGTNHADLQAAVRTGLATARQVRKRFTIWVRPCAGFGGSSNTKCEHFAGARRAKGYGAAAPTMHTCRPPCPRALQPHGKCENGLRSGSYVLAAARWPRQIVQDIRACRWRATRGANHGDLQAAVPTRLATARQLRKRFYGQNRI